MTQSNQDILVDYEIVESHEHHHHHSITSWSLPTPWTIQEIQPHLHFYIGGQEEPIVVPYTEDPAGTLAEIQSAGFLTGKTSRIIFITHGFENDVTTPWLPQMKDEILKVDGNALVVLLGWGKGADINPLKYSQASANTQTVAKWLARYLVEIRKLSQDIFIWGIAHSLGAHLLGLAGRESSAFNRITGLDPAGPSFEKVNQENRLRSTDAGLVDVIHTDGYDTMFDPADWFAPVNHYGTLIPLGTIDFYPNFGFRQPGISHFSIAGSHHRSIELFIWSIGNPGAFRTNAIIDGIPAFESPVEKVKYVEERAEMGFHFDIKKNPLQGLFYLETNKAEPWREEQQEDQAEFSWGFRFGWGSCTVS